MMDAIERIEVALRSRIAYYHTENQSPFAYACPTYFPNWKGYIQGLERVRKQKNKQEHVVPPQLVKGGNIRGRGDILHLTGAGA